MNLYIRYVNGEFTTHPMLEENCFQTIPNFDPNNLPEDLVKFIRVPAPAASGPYVKIVSSYVLLPDGTATDQHDEISIPLEERYNKIHTYRTTVECPMGWHFDEELCSYVPPVPYPDDGKFYRWDIARLQWVEIIIETEPNSP
jgi:hypothetical protein